MNIPPEVEIAEQAYQQGINAQKNSFEKKLLNVDRFEVINHSIEGEAIGRIFTTYNANGVEMSFQDGGKTLKIFL